MDLLPHCHVSFEFIILVFHCSSFLNDALRLIITSLNACSVEFNKQNTLLLGGCTPQCSEPIQHICSLSLPTPSIASQASFLKLVASPTVFWLLYSDYNNGDQLYSDYLQGWHVHAHVGHPSKFCQTTLPQLPTFACQGSQQWAGTAEHHRIQKRGWSPDHSISSHIASGGMGVCAWKILSAENYIGITLVSANTADKTFSPRVRQGVAAL